MSGGAWDYMQNELEQRAKQNAEVWRLLSAIEHELDWGVSADTCLKCAKLRIGSALIHFFDTKANDASVAISVAKDRSQNKCENCEARKGFGG